MWKRCDENVSIITLVVHYDLELNQTNMKIAFLKGDLEEVYMDQSFPRRQMFPLNWTTPVSSSKWVTRVKIDDMDIHWPFDYGLVWKYSTYRLKHAS